MDIKKEFERWLVNATADADVAAELKMLDDTKIEDAFYRDLAFGTGGLRGVIGAGTNRMNVYTVAKASQGLADYLKKNFETPSVTIGYDSRIKSDVFAKIAAGVFAANGVKVNIWPVLMPVPTVSFATRYEDGTRRTVMPVHRYGDYHYYFQDGVHVCIPEKEFENLRWELRFLMESESRIEHYEPKEGHTGDKNNQSRKAKLKNRMRGSPLAC